MTARTAVVTGGSRGIGLAIGARLLADGHNVVITGRDEQRLAEAARELGSPSGLSVLALDATDHVAASRELARIAPDILVANVGAGHSASIADTALEDWARLLDTNVTSAFVAVKATLPAMLERNWGRIVTIGSLASHHAIRFGVAYTSSKHALWGLTRAAALDTKKTGITVNMVAPAFVRTEMTTQNAQTIATASSRTVEEVEEQLAGISDLGRLIEPDEVATEVAAFIDNASRTAEIAIMGNAASS